MFNEGAAVSWVTRIIKQQERSNFVWQDFLLGAYFSVTSRNMRPFDFTIRTTAYYPFSMTFNEHPQKPATPLHFAFDLYAENIENLGLEGTRCTFVTKAGSFQAHILGEM